MIKTLIADDNFIYIKKFVNNIINKLNNIQIEYICTDGNEVLDIIRKNNFDLIILDLKMPNLNGIEVIKKIRKIDMINKAKIIIISGDSGLLKYAEINDIVCKIISKMESDEVIYEKVKEIINQIEYERNYKLVRKKVISELIALGYNIKHKGTRYILDVIMYIYRYK